MELRKIPLIFAIFLLLSFSFLQITVEASPETVVRVEPQTILAKVGERFNVSIMIDDVQNLYGVEVYLHWNSTLLQAVNATSQLGAEDHAGGVLHSPVITLKNNINQSLGSYLILGVSMPPAGSFNGSGTIAIVMFTVVDNGTCPIDLSTTLASNVLGESGVLPIEHTKLSGFFGQRPLPPQTDWTMPIAIAVAITAIVVSSVVLAMFVRKRGKHGR